MELAGLEPATSWVRCRLPHGALGIRSCRFAGALYARLQGPLRLDRGGYPGIPLGFRHAWRLVPERARLLCLLGLQSDVDPAPLPARHSLCETPSGAARRRTTSIAATSRTSY